MGELLTQLVPHDAYVRIPVATDSSPGRSTQCYRVCRCGRHNLLHQCREIGCTAHDQCQLRYGMILGMHTWQFSVAVTRWSRSTQLFYIEPGW